MKETYTHISVILDRTGSMEPIRDDTIGGFNTFLENQKQESGEATMTLVQFDSEDPYEVIHHFKRLALVPRLTQKTYVPRGCTPLYDAIGRGIVDLDTNLKRIDPAEQPGKVIFVIVTDGEENASREFSAAQIRKMIDEKTTSAGWQFVFLSSDLRALEEAESVGFKDDARLHFKKSATGTRGAWRHLSSASSGFRKGSKKQVDFSDKD